MIWGEGPSQLPSLRSSRLGPFVVAAAFASAILTSWPIRGAQAPQPATGLAFARISEEDTKEWLTYLASDELQGREVFTEGYGLAAAYIAEHLRQWGLKPLGDDGTFLQSVKQRGYRVTSNSSITVEVKGERRTFKDGDHITFPRESGGKQTVVFNGVEFLGYGQPTPEPKRPQGDFTGRDVKGKLVVYLPGGRGVRSTGRGSTADRSNEIVRTQGAAAAMTFEPSSGAVNDSGSPAGGRGAGPPRAVSTTPDIITVERLDRLMAPVPVGDETFYEFVFSASPTPFEALRAKWEKGEPIGAFTLPGVKVTINVDNTFAVLSTELTENVVAMVEGTDPKLRGTYVFFGAHLDHVGYAKGTEAKGRVNTPIEQDRIWNGADDDGSGSVGLMAIAKAFATGPKPRRSVVFVWHAGEEAGLLGSRYMADYPVVPLENVQAELNIDMIGRNRDDKASEANTLYVIGADRISTDLHNLLIGTNRALPRPMTLDFEYNDVADVNTFYTRSDHFSYASKGIPIAFFFTGTHDDYHANTDSVDKILFPKLVRAADLIYRLGFGVANSQETLARDNRGSRSGKGFSGPLPK